MFSLQKTEGSYHSAAGLLRRKTFPGKSIHTEISPLRSPGFPVETRGFEDLHAALFKESRTRGRG